MTRNNTPQSGQYEALTATLQAQRNLWKEHSFPARKDPAHETKGQRRFGRSQDHSVEIAETHLRPLQPTPPRRQKHQAGKRSRRKRACGIHMGYGPHRDGQTVIRSGLKNMNRIRSNQNARQGETKAVYRSNHIRCFRCSSLTRGGTTRARRGPGGAWRCGVRA